MQRFNSSLTVLVATVFLFAANVSAHAGVLLYATSFYSNSAFAVNSDGSTTPFSTSVDRASGIAVDATGNVYVASQGSNSVLKFNSAGTLLGTFATADISAPVGLAFNASGNLFVANNAKGTITQYSSTGSLLGTFATGLQAPMGLATDTMGNVFVSEILTAGGLGRIQKFNSSGSKLAETMAGMSYPGQLALDSLGNVYVSNAGGAMILRYSNSLLNQSLFANGVGSNNYGLAYDTASNTFFQGTLGPTPNPLGAIRRFDANGNSIGFLATSRPTSYFLATIPPASVAAVPEPSALAWAGVLGLIGLTLRRRKS